MKIKLVDTAGSGQLEPPRLVLEVGGSSWPDPAVDVDKTHI